MMAGVATSELFAEAAGLQGEGGPTFVSASADTFSQEKDLPTSERLAGAAGLQGEGGPTFVSASADTFSQEKAKEPPAGGEMAATLSGAYRPALAENDPQDRLSGRCEPREKAQGPSAGGRTGEIAELPHRRDAGELIVAQETQLRTLESCVGQLGAMLAAMQRRLDMLEQENKMRLTINHQQAKGLQTLIRGRAAALCQKYSLDEKRHGAAFRAAIKRDILKLYGVKDLHDLPLFAQQEAMSRIDGWSDIRLVLKRREIDRGLDT